MSTLEDAQKCLQFIIDCFLEAAEKPVFFVKSIENQSSEDIKNQSRYVISSDKSVNQSVSDSVSHVNNNAQSVKSEDRNFVAESKPPPSIDTKTKVPKNIPSVIENKSKLTIDCLSDGSVGDVQKSGLAADSLAEDGSKLVKGSGRRLTDIFLYPIKSCAAFKVCLLLNP